VGSILSALPAFTKIGATHLRISLRVPSFKLSLKIPGRCNAPHREPQGDVVYIILVTIFPRRFRVVGDLFNKINFIGYAAVFKRGKR
jgi:hypothetical protein